MDRPQSCVLCRTEPVDPRWRPFCSRRCQTADLGRWADEAYRVPGPPHGTPDEGRPEADEFDEHPSDAALRTSS